MKKQILTIALAMAGSAAFAQADDPIIMSVAGTDVPRSEFEYSYNKNNTEGVIDKKTVEEYVDLFVNYKLKVQAALDAKLDTMLSYQKEFRMYRDQQVIPSLITDEDMEREARQIYDITQQAVGSKGLIKPAHILTIVRQNATDREAAEAKQQIDSIYKLLLNGADFADMAARFSQDVRTAKNGGELPWVGPGQTLKEFENVAYALNKGQLSAPVQSPAGWHIILLKDKKQLEPYDSLRDDIMKFMADRNARDQMGNQLVDSVSKQRGISREQYLDERSAELQAENSDLGYLVKEYHDGLLLYEISNREVWGKAAKDEAALAEYFKKNKKKYKWNEPRYKGMVYHVKTPGDVDAVKNCVKDLPFGQWADKLRQTFNNDSVLRIRVEKGIFKKGDNAFIDSMVFKKAAKITPVKDFPIDAVYGKILKKGPEEYTDVKSIVTADYQDELEKAWVEELRRKYTVTVNKDVLKTVNNH